ncbi:C45 family autoproteolytic acyltransferase/hydolase [Paeniglutamicibacter sp. NPDC091659]|uniref:C45 family autoproteolytic acyltransferase/hydolase n=1 Tax=Paeniglutamicibacter sp. NPDC091659 TaxID=3364389 RepID=UPI00381515F2
MHLQRFSTTTTDPQERGRQIGARWSEQIRNTSELYVGFFVAMGLDHDWIRTKAEHSHDALRIWRPALAEELDACSLGAGVPAWHLQAVNARTEILAAAASAGGAECSTVIYSPSGANAPQTIQTWDWHEELVPEGLLLELIPAPGRTVKLFTEFGALGKIGVNSHGIGLHFNILSHVSDDASGGVPVHAIARAILDEASTLEDAVAIAASARVSASTALTVVSSNGYAPGSVSIELSPAGTRVVPMDGNGWLIRTNHFLDPGLGVGDTIPSNSATRERFAHLESARTDMAGREANEMASAMCGNEGPEAVVCFHPDYNLPAIDQWKTLLTIRLDTIACDLEVAATNPYEASLTGFTRF